MPPAGRLNQRLILQKRDPDAGRDGHGRIREEWLSVAILWGEVLSSGGGERVEHGQVQADATHTVRIHYRAGVESAMRWDWNGKKLNILSAGDPDGRRVDLLCQCKEQV